MYEIKHESDSPLLPTQAHIEIMEDSGLTAKRLPVFEAVGINNDNNGKRGLVDYPYWNTIINDLVRFARAIPIIAAEIDSYK